MNPGKRNKPCITIARTNPTTTDNSQATTDRPTRSLFRKIADHKEHQNLATPHTTAMHLGSLPRAFQTPNPGSLAIALSFNRTIQKENHPENSKINGLSEVVATFWLCSPWEGGQSINPADLGSSTSGLRGSKGRGSGSGRGPSAAAQGVHETEPPAAAATAFEHPRWTAGCEGKEIIRNTGASQQGEKQRGGVEEEEAAEEEG